MKKRVLVSVALAVLLLEVGFGVYVAFERKYESALSSLVLPVDSVKPIQIDTYREHEIASVLPEEALVDDTRAVVTARKAAAQPVKGKSADTKLASTRLVSSGPVEKPAKSRAGTEPPKQAVAVRISEVREVPAADLNAQKEPVRTDNKSFIAKTGTILKKPFGWIKAIGSKLR
ncbi:MAG: hypothetical protein ACKVQW_00935 [Pyrinomonadaceae bacterium]